MSNYKYNILSDDMPSAEVANSFTNLCNNRVHTNREKMNYDTCAKNMLTAMLDGKYKTLCNNIGPNNEADLVKRNFTVTKSDKPGKPEEVCVSWEQLHNK